MEVSSKLAATANTVLSANIQYLDATYSRFVYSLPNLGGPPTTGCPYTPNGASFLINCNGNTAPESPRWSLSLSAQQTFPFAWGNLVVSGQTKFQTESYAGIQYLPEQLQKSYWMSGAALTYHAPHHRWTIGAFVNNIENARILANSTPEPLVGAALMNATLYPPRTYGVRVGAKF